MFDCITPYQMQGENGHKHGATLNPGNHTITEWWNLKYNTLEAYSYHPSKMVFSQNHNLVHGLKFMHKWNPHFG